MTIRLLASVAIGVLVATLSSNAIELGNRATG